MNKENMTPKFKVTIEYIEDGKSQTNFQQEFDPAEINITQERFLSPRYEIGQFQPVGFWDSGNSVLISAIKRKNPEAV